MVVCSLPKVHFFLLKKLVLIINYFSQNTATLSHTRPWTFFFLPCNSVVPLVFCLCSLSHFLYVCLSLPHTVSAATCASYNFSFLSPQGLNFSSQSSAPFWSGTALLACLCSCIIHAAFPNPSSHSSLHLSFNMSSRLCFHHHLISAPDIHKDQH